MLVSALGFNWCSSIIFMSNQNNITLRNFFISDYLSISTVGYDTRSEECQRFFREGLTMSFHKILNDEAVNGWKYEIHVCKISHICTVIVYIIYTNFEWLVFLEMYFKEHRKVD